MSRGRPPKQYPRPGPRKNPNYWINEVVVNDFQQWCRSQAIMPSELIEELMVALMQGTLSTNLSNPASNQTTQE